MVQPQQSWGRSQIVSDPVVRMSWRDEGRGTGVEGRGIEDAGYWDWYEDEDTQLVLGEVVRNNDG